LPEFVPAAPRIIKLGRASNPPRPNTQTRRWIVLWPPAGFPLWCRQERASLHELARWTGLQPTSRCTGLVAASDLTRRCSQRQTVHDDDVAAPQGRGQNLLDVEKEGFAVDRPLDEHGAVMRSWRKAAMKVMVCQRPCGTLA
jgi:hypothetical protein